ncbi:hypothetical protein KKC97_03345 [bacterium]|nr:hypothetical protein [bacterium]MBU1636681.1 hypothetical protein [bacterium]
MMIEEFERIEHDGKISGEQVKELIADAIEGAYGERHEVTDRELIDFFKWATEMFGQGGCELNDFTARFLIATKRV